MSAQPFSRADRNRRARGEFARINRAGQPPRWKAWPGFGPRRRRNGSVIPAPVTAEAARFHEARRARLAAQVDR